MTDHAPPGGTVRWCATERRGAARGRLPGAMFHPDYRLGGAPRVAARRTRSRRRCAARSSSAASAGRPTSSSPASCSSARGRSRAPSPRSRQRGEILAVLGDAYGARRVARSASTPVSATGERGRYPAVSGAATSCASSSTGSTSHPAPGARASTASRTVIAQLQGVEVAVGAWEETGAAGAGRADYRPHLLDELCAHGAIAWGRLSLRADDDRRRARASATPSRATPVALVGREDLSWLLAAARGGAHPARPSRRRVGGGDRGPRASGALFFADLCAATGRLAARDRRRALGRRRAWPRHRRRLRGGAPRSSPGRYRSDDRSPATPRRRALRPSADGARVPPALAGGRWSLLEAHGRGGVDPDELAEAVAGQLLDRWGVVFRDLVRRESFALPWREVLCALRRLEARGRRRGGRFVAGPVGEQFALPEALAQLRAVASRPLDGTLVRLSAADPLNLTGPLLSGERVPAIAGHELVLVDGLPRRRGARARRGGRRFGPRTNALDISL